MVFFFGSGVGAIGTGRPAVDVEGPPSVVADLILDCGRIDSRWSMKSVPRFKDGRSSC